MERQGEYSSVGTALKAARFRLRSRRGRRRWYWSLAIAVVVLLVEPPLGPIWGHEVRVWAALYIALSIEVALLLVCIRLVGAARLRLRSRRWRLVWYGSLVIAPLAFLAAPLLGPPLDGQVSVWAALYIILSMMVAFPAVMQHRLRPEPSSRA